MDRKRRVNTIFRITALVLVQVFLLLECGWAGGGSIIPRPQTDYPANLSPRVCIDISQFQNVFYQQAVALTNNTELKPPSQITKTGNNLPQERNMQFIVKIMREWMNSEQLKNLGSALFAFGSARFKEENAFSKVAFSFARRAALANFAIITGGGPGIMLAANKGAFGVATSIGLNIKLPYEEKANLNQDISLLFNYFFLRKLVFVLFSRGGAVFPGGFGTLEEVFEVLAFNLRHPDAMRPVVLVNADFYGGLMEVLANWHKAGIMPKLDDKVFTLRHTEKEAFEYLAHLWTENPKREKMDIWSFVNALFRASRRLYRVELTVAIIGGDRIEPGSDLGRMAFELVTAFTDKGISVMRRGHEGIAASVAGAYEFQAGTSKPGRGLFICLKEGVPDVRDLKADRTFYFPYNSALKVAMLKHSTLGFVFFPGGIDTLDMLFEVLCLIQTGKIEPVPIVLVGEKWQELYDWIEKVMVLHKTIKKKDLALVKMARTKEEAEQIIFEAYRNIKSEKIAREVSPYLKQIIDVLKRYRSERIITRYYLTGSFLKGGLEEDGDIDVALLLRSYNRPDAIKRLLQEVEAIAEKSPYKIHITPQAYGYEYEFKEGKFVHTGVIRSEELLTRLPSPQRQSLLRLDNLEIPFLPDEFFLKMMRNCREFDFTQNNWKLVSDKNKSRNDHSIYKEDLESIDPAVRLKAAIVLKKQGQENSKLAKIFQDSASNKNLTLDERLKAAEFLSESEKEKFSFELGMDEQHSLRIDSGEEKDFKKLTLELATREETAKIIKGIPGIEPQLAAEFISRMQQINWHAQELEKTLQGVGYFNGEWEKELKERLEYDYDVPYEALDMLIKRDLPAEVIFSPLQYLFAALIAQEVIGKLRQNNAVILEGDREWFLLEAFKSVREKMSVSLAETGKIKDVLGDKWKNSTAISRTIDIFEGLKNLGFYTNRYESDVELEAVLGSAGKFIARAYDDSGQAEFAPGPCYDQRGVSIGIESNLGKKQDSIHINQGVKWASKYIWAAYLAMYTHIKNETFTPVKFDYYYRQLVKDTNKFNNMNHRISYIGVWVKDIRDLAMILEIFIPLSIALGNYMDQKDMALARIFRDFRKEIESIIRKQNDVQLDREFFEQARMVRFVELVSANNRDNDFYRDLSRLITDTLTKIETHLTMKKKEKDYPVQELSGSIDHAFEAKQLPKLLTPQYPYALIEQAI